jgi:ComEC/Rec2-related protein
MKYSLVLMAAGFAGGVAISDWIGSALPPWAWSAGAAAALAFAVALGRLPMVRRAALIAAILCLGVLRVACERPFPDWLQLRTPSLREVEGTVVSYPSIGSSYVTFTLQPDVLAERLRIYWFHDAPPIGAVHYGDRVRLSGSAEIPEPFDGFDYPGYLARQGIFATMAVDEGGLEAIGESGKSAFRWGDRLRQTTLERFDRWLPPDESGMARGLLFGDRAALPDAIEAAFSRTGLMHLLAVSGLHLGIFLGGAWWILRRLGWRPRTAYPAVGLLVLVALWVVGPRISLVRASLLFAFLALGSVLADVGLILRRSIHPMNGLAAAAIAMLAMRPGALYDAGFQLTFAATASILVAFSEPFAWHRRIADYANRFGRLSAPIRRMLTVVAVAAAAQAGAAPVIAWHFETIHPLALAANLIVVPLAGLALWCGFGAILLSGTSLLPHAIAPFSSVLTGLKAIVIGLARIPLSEFEVPSWMGVWIGALIVYAFSVAAYSRGASSWTWKSMSIELESSERTRGVRPPRRKKPTTSTSPTTSLNRPGINRRRPPTKSSPSD